MSGRDIDDNMYQNWKMYRSKCSSKDTSPKEIIEKHVPVLNVKSKTTKQNAESNPYFVISVDELYEEKLKKEAEEKQMAMEK